MGDDGAPAAALASRPKNFFNIRVAYDEKSIFLLVRFEQKMCGNS